ncbi:N-acetylglutamate synthase [Hydrogenivirga caldilitoris]|uniref:N-acetylglutamate synthase n=1 Tax=Hydrogenivirga caldilitoris TaxID=246264 RepID=A0A497XLZ0_9AQUI|nr:N-acetyltransferase [Hydrogenivirga caldilitoris]RLJ69855.1 N-acetylglutamate synthase [Hydrogenivirga caldilitoris]
MVRKARLSDAQAIHSLVNEYALQGVLLPRSLSSIYEHIRDFWVYEEGGEVLGCCALQIVWADLAEIRSFAVRKDRKGLGIGKALISSCIEEAKSLGIKKVFSLTYAKDYFERFGFRVVDKSTLPHKVWGDCINCVKFPNCDEIAVILELDGNAAGVLEGSLQIHRW